MEPASLFGTDGRTGEIEACLKRPGGRRHRATNSPGSSSSGQRPIRRRMTGCWPVSGKTIRNGRSGRRCCFSVARMNFEEDGTPNRHAWHDTGMAALSLSPQATAMGLVAHQMAGFDGEMARVELKIPAGYEPVAMIAVGYPGDRRYWMSGLRRRELASRERKVRERSYPSGAGTCPGLADRLKAPRPGYGRRTRACHSPALKLISHLFDRDLVPIVLQLVADRLEMLRPFGSQGDQREDRTSRATRISARTESKWNVWEKWSEYRNRKWDERARSNASRSNSKARNHRHTGPFPLAVIGDKGVHDCDPVPSQILRVACIRPVPILRRRSHLLDHMIQELEELPLDLCSGRLIQWVERADRATGGRGIR